MYPNVLILSFYIMYSAKFIELLYLITFYVIRLYNTEHLKCTSMPHLHNFKQHITDYMS